MGGMTINIIAIALCFVLVFYFIIVLIIRDYHKVKLIAAENFKKEKEQFYKQYPQFFVRENWECLGIGIFNFKPTNEYFQLYYNTYSNGENVISGFTTPPGFSNVFNITKRDFIKNYLWAIIKESLKDKHSKLTNSVKDKYQPAFKD